MPQANQSIAILNAIRNSASAEYVARVPLATRTNITAVGNALLSAPTALNEFTQTLVERIALTVFASQSFDNKLSIFKKGLLPYGSNVQEIYVGMAKAEGSYDKAYVNIFGANLPDVSVNYHKRNRADMYKVSVSDEQCRSAFTSAGGVSELLAEIVQSMYTGSNYDEYVLMKELIGTYSTSFVDYGVTAITSEATARTFLKTVRKAVIDLSFMSPNFNQNRVNQISNLNDMVLLVNKDVMATITVDALASAFNVEKLDIQPTVIMVDDFGSMTDTYAVLVDKKWFMIWDTIRNVESARNPATMTTNYFLNIQQILSLSRFKNAIRFTTIPKVAVP